MSSKDKNTQNVSRNKSGMNSLRKRAEEIAAANKQTSLVEMTAEENRRMLHELQVHQIELEMQNDELNRIVCDLEIARERYYDLYNHAPVGYVTINKKGIIMEANLTIARMLGVEQKKIIKQPMSRFIFKEDQDIYYLHRKKLFEQKEPQNCDLRMIGEGDNALWVHVSGTISENEDGILNCRTILSDITKRKNAEEEILALNLKLEERVTNRTEQLEKTNHELGSFSYSVSHNLRSPLRAINGYSEIILEEYSASLQPEVLNLLNIIHKNSIMMGILIDELLNYSKLGEQDLTLKKVVLKPVIQEIITNYQEEINHRNIQFEIEYLPDCLADPVLIHQVFDNLISNAIKYTRKQTHPIIHIGFSKAILPEKGDNSQKEIPCYFIKDNGIGFDMKHYDKLFGVFQRLHHSEDFEGIGIGLAFVSSMIRKHKGHIWANAKIGEGATFYFTIGEHDFIEEYPDPIT